MGLTHTQAYIIKDTRRHLSLVAITTRHRKLLLIIIGLITNNN